jgi:hypothetical protein
MKRGAKPALAPSLGNFLYDVLNWWNSSLVRNGNTWRLILISKSRYLLTVGFLECRYRFRMLVLHLRYCSTRVEKLLLPIKCFLFRRKIRRLNRQIERLYLLDDARCLSVLGSLNKLNHQSGNLNNGFLWGHNNVSVFLQPNDELSDRRE